ncbi:acyl-CoA N-acyltransferase [Dichotomocladium elegans]|nr:acyl-CoA N-acyltransferase [Dichotomocladium elegans]
MSLVFTPASLQDLDTVAALETASYHPDEAASREKLANRIGYAAETDLNLFMVARRVSDNAIAGFVCSTLSQDPLVTDESMESHDRKGTTVCIHSVCVAPDFRRQGIATALLKHMIAELKAKNQYKRVALISRPVLISLYEAAGFKYIGKSELVHGPDPWFDMVVDF